MDTDEVLEEIAKITSFSENRNIGVKCLRVNTSQVVMVAFQERKWGAKRVEY